MYKHHKFTMIDIKDFYPSVSKKVLTDAFTFVEIIIKLHDHERKDYTTPVNRYVSIKTKHG